MSLSLLSLFYQQDVVEQLVSLDSNYVRSLQTISLRLERLVSGAVAKHGRASEQTLELLSLPIKDGADQNDLARIADNCIARIEVIRQAQSHWERCGLTMLIEKECTMF